MEIPVAGMSKSSPTDPFFLEVKVLVNPLRLIAKDHMPEIEQVPFLKSLDPVTFAPVFFEGTKKNVNPHFPMQEFHHPGTDPRVTIFPPPESPEKNVQQIHPL